MPNIHICVHTQVDPTAPPPPPPLLPQRSTTEYSEEGGPGVGTPPGTPGAAVPPSPPPSSALPLAMTPVSGPAAAPLVPYLALRSATAEALVSGALRADRVGALTMTDAVGAAFYNNGNRSSVDGGSLATASVGGGGGASSVAAGPTGGSTGGGGGGSIAGRGSTDGSDSRGVGGGAKLAAGPLTPASAMDWSLDDLGFSRPAAAPVVPR